MIQQIQSGEHLYSPLKINRAWEIIELIFSGKYTVLVFTRDLEKWTQNVFRFPFNIQDMPIILFSILTFLAEL